MGIILPDFAVCLVLQETYISPRCKNVIARANTAWCCGKPRAADLHAHDLFSRLVYSAYSSLIHCSAAIHRLRNLSDHRVGGI